MMLYRPAFGDFNVYSVNIPLADNDEDVDRVTWTEDNHSTNNNSNTNNMNKHTNDNYDNDNTNDTTTHSNYD